MGNPTGFKEIDRILPPDRDPLKRIRDWNDFHGHADVDQLREQASRCMDCGTPFCHTGDGKSDTRQTVGCPLNNLIPEWNDLVYKDLWKEASERLHKTNNFPEFTGKVCPAPCESSCVLAIIEPAVTIKNTELTIVERAFTEGWIKATPPTKRTGKNVAIVGSGPAGLACADQLNKAGHTVTVFERSDRIGGLLVYGIPNMKLEKHLVERRVQLMKEEGIEFITNIEIGKNIPVTKLKEDFDATVLCCGATKARDISIPGRELNGIHQAMEYLTENSKTLLKGKNGEQPRISAKNKDVLVIGGGDTGTDCVGTAIRQGCRSITQIEIVPQFPEKLPWPTFGRTSKLDYGQKEAKEKFNKDPRLFSITAEKFSGDENEVTKTKLVEVMWNRSNDGTMAPVLKSGTERIIPTQLVLLSMGFLGPEEKIIEDLNLDRDERSNVAADYGKFSTSVKGVFACGDIRRGASLVVWAIMEGRGAARECDRYLMGSTVLP